MSLFSKWFSNKTDKSREAEKNEAVSHSAAEYCEIGEKSLVVGKYVEAMEYFQAAIEADKRFEKAYLLLANSYERQGNMVKAKATIHALLAIDPDNEAALTKLEQLSKSKQPERISDNTANNQVKEPVSTAPQHTSNPTRPIQPLNNGSLKYRVFASNSTDSFDFFIVFDNGNKLYFKIVDAKRMEACVVAPAKTFGRYNSTGCWEGYKLPEGIIQIPNTIEYNGLIYSVTAVDKCAFINCGPIKKVIIPDTITIIGEEAFKNCGLEEVKLSNTLEGIGAASFSCCRSLKAIDLPDSVIRIGNDAFSNCDQLNSIKFPNSIEIIESNTLIGCSKLSSITIPSSVKGIQSHAFGNYYYSLYGGTFSLTLIMESKTPPKVGPDFIISEKISHNKLMVTIIVPKGALEAYMNAQYWQLYDIQEKQ